MSRPSNEERSLAPATPNPNLGRDKSKHNNYRRKDNYKDEEFSERIDEQIKSGKKLHGNSRKNQISINHLLDFQSYESLQEYQDRRKGNGSGSSNQRGGGRRRSSGSNGNKLRSNPFKVNLHGMSYINCHYKFVVDCRSDYKPQQLDPNVPVNVSDILRIITPKGNACPICLSDDPVAPRMITSCGHILCLTCLLSLLDSEVPTSGKKSAGVGEIKYNDCPLCSTIIRQKDIKPVLISNVDERFEVPNVKDEVALTLMTRPQSKILSLPKNFYDFHNMIDTFPWVHGPWEDEASDMQPNFTVYLRFLMGDLQYLIDMYEMEKLLILAQYEQEKELYGDDGKYFKLAISNIDKDIEEWKKNFEMDHPLPSTKQLQRQSNGKQNTELQPGSNTFFYYQTGFNASSTYVLSPLDMKVLKHSYNEDYHNLPSSIVAKVENIRYEEFNAELALTKYKYLSHLPFGTSIGFLECDWSSNKFIQEETWETFKGDLIQRSKKSNRKFKREEMNRRRALNNEEMKNREFYERENNNGVLTNNHNSYAQHYSDYYDDSSNGGSFSSMTRNIGNLSVLDYRDLPVLSSDNAVPSLVEGTTESGTIDTMSGTSDEISGSPKYQTTIWGTKIPKADPVLNPQPQDSEDDWDAEEMIRRAKEEMDRQESETGGSKKKKKKKKILLSSGW